MKSAWLWTAGAVVAGAAVVEAAFAAGGALGGRSGGAAVAPGGVQGGQPGGKGLGKDGGDEGKKDDGPQWETKEYKGYFICSCAQMAAAGPHGKDFDKGKHDACIAERLPVFFKVTKELTDAGETDADKTFLVAGTRSTDGKVEEISDYVLKKLLNGNAVFEVRCEVYEPGKEKTLPAVLFHRIGGEKSPVWERKEKKKGGGVPGGMFGTR